MDQLWLLLGRFHPVAVHLPIGLFVLLAIVELAALFPRMARLANAQRTLVLALGLLFSLLTSLLGWMLAREGGYDAALLGRHRMLGIAVAALAAILFLVHLRRWQRAYATVLVAMILVTVAAGHLGGSLTHGENYLSAIATSAKRVPVADPAHAMVFADVVHPILQQRCASCHGATKSNGDLRYDALEELLKGGKTGPAFKPGNAAASAMIKRVYLPVDAKEHMPPKGKPQLTDDELALIEWWINAGAPTDKRVAQASPPPAVVELIASQLGVPPPPLPDRATMLAAARALERSLGIIIRPLDADGPWLAANARLQFAKFGDAQLAQLAPIAPALRWLDAGETSVTDAGFPALAAMKNLRRLHLDRTAVTDAGIAGLSGLAQLEYVNLRATKVTDVALKTLEALPRLRSLYVWETQMTPAAVAKFVEQQVDQRKVARWKSEIAALEARIRDEQITASIGERLVPVKKAPMPQIAAPLSGASAELLKSKL